MTPRRYRRQGHPKKVDIFHGETGHQAGETARGIIAHSSHLLSSSFHLSPTIIEPSSPAHLELADCHSYLHHITPHKKVLANTMPGVVQGPSTLYDKVFAQHIVRWWEEQEFWWCDL